MAKAELGDKQNCPSCGAKFYDLRRRPAHCPKCHHEFDPDDDTVKLRRVRTRPVNYEQDYEDDDDDAPKKVAAAAETDEEDAVEETTEEVTPELGDGVGDEPDLILEDEDEAAPATPDALPAGFSETDGDEDIVADDADDVPMLDDDEDFAGGDIEELSEEPDADEEPR